MDAYYSRMDTCQQIHHLRIHNNTLEQNHCLLYMMVYLLTGTFPAVVVHHVKISSKRRILGIEKQLLRWQLVRQLDVLE